MRTLLFCIVFFLSGCSLLSGLGDSFNPLKEDKGIDTNLQLGKENSNVDKKGLINLDDGSKSYTTNNITAENYYSSTSNKDSAWLIIGFGIMCGFFVKNVFSYFSRRKANKIGGDL